MFLSGIGVPRIVSLVHTDQISLDYRTLSIDLPGSGSLLRIVQFAAVPEGFE